MAQRAAIASGNWSNPAIWNAGVLPGPEDIVGSNGFNVTIDISINANTISNAALALTTIVPIMTSNTTPSGIVASSGVWTNNPEYDSWKAFSGSGSYLANPTAFWLSYEFPTPRAVSSYTMGPSIGGTSFTMRDWTFEGWNGISWVVLHTVANNLPASWGSGYASPNIGNTTAYIRYRINCTAVNSGASYVSIAILRLFEVYSVASVAGGGFILNDGVTVTCTNATNGIAAGAATCLTYPGTVTATINSNVYSSATNNVRSIVKTGTGVLNFNGTLDGNANNSLTLNNSTGVTNIVGLIRKTGGSISNLPILVSGTGNTINITGDVQGNVTGGGTTKRTFLSGGNNIINITGTVDGSPLSSTNDYVFAVGTNDIVNIIGNVIGHLGAFNFAYSIVATTACYIKIVGSITAGAGGPGLFSTSTSAINILTGPFISSPSGIQPIYVARMNYQRTMGSYFEFRDNSTNGALPPAAAAPATRLVSPDTVVDAPIPANVRQGVVYASGSQTGTMIVPSPSNVTINVPVDNTVGTAILNADNLWAIDTSTMNTANSIGERLKNAATVQTVGDQLVSLL